MVDAEGHLAFGLLFAVPAWFIWRKRVAVAFVVLALMTSLLPDVDVWLETLFPAQFHHHGFTHTVAFVVLVSVLAGAVATAILTRPLDDWLGWDHFDAKSVFGFAFLAFLLGGLSHIFADILSAPDISTPIEPFWPFFDEPWSLDVIYYNDPLWNSIFLLVMVLVHVAVASFVTPTEHRFRFRRQVG
jgi:membrane-bound metal-dependent hydrolase YbcI (DUF457 family)